MKILITGVAGFLGFSVAQSLLAVTLFNEIVGVDNLNAYYDVKLKRMRLAQLYKFGGKFEFVKLDVSSSSQLDKFMAMRDEFDVVFHFAEQAGVRFSFEAPLLFSQWNIIGFNNVIHKFRHVHHFIYASSGYVYGNSGKLPSKETDNIRELDNLYAYTKYCNELCARMYNTLYGLKSTGIRYFSVYGPSGRPDSVLYRWLNEISSNRVPEIYGENCQRDFVFIDDAVKASVLLMDRKDLDVNTCDIYNVGSGVSISLRWLFELVKEVVGLNCEPKVVNRIFNEAVSTQASITKLKRVIRFVPGFNLAFGLKKVFDWYCEWTGWRKPRPIGFNSLRKHPEM